MFKFLKRVVKQDEKKQTITFTYEVTKESITAKVDMLNSFAEVLAVEATRFMEAAKNGLPVMELKLTAKSRPVSIFVVVDNQGSPLEMIRELKIRLQNSGRTIQQIGRENITLRERNEELKRKIGDIIDNGVIEVRKRDTNMEQSMGGIPVRQSEVETE